MADIDIMQTCFSTKFVVTINNIVVLVTTQSNIIYTVVFRDSLLYSFGQNKVNIWTTPSFHFNDAKMVQNGLLLRAFIISLGGRQHVIAFSVNNSEN